MRLLSAVLALGFATAAAQAPAPSPSPFPLAPPAGSSCRQAIFAVSGSMAVIDPPVDTPPPTVVPPSPIDPRGSSSIRYLMPRLLFSGR